MNCRKCGRKLPPGFSNCPDCVPYYKPITRKHTPKSTDRPPVTGWEDGPIFSYGREDMGWSESYLHWPVLISGSFCALCCLGVLSVGTGTGGWPGPLFYILGFLLIPAVPISFLTLIVSAVLTIRDEEHRAHYVIAFCLSALLPLALLSLIP